MRQKKKKYLFKRKGRGLYIDHPTAGFIYVVERVGVPAIPCTLILLNQALNCVTFIHREVTF